MNKSNFKSFFLVALTALAALSCQENETQFADLSELSPEALKFFGLQGSAQTANRAAGNSGASMINKSFSAAKAGNPSLSISGASTSDSTLAPTDPIQWVTCARISETQNPDGTTTTVTDYGDGCNEGYGDYQYIMRGKITTTYRNDQSQKGSVFTYSYYNRNKLENYGGSYIFNGDTSTWQNNGRSTYYSYSDYDTAKQTFSGNYTWSDSSKYGYAMRGKITDTYVSNTSGKVVYNEKKSVTSSSRTEYFTGQDYYSTTVIVPLVMDYSCNPWSLVAKSETMRCIMPFTYVSGRERIEYIRNGVSGSFEVDYGNGECDTIITIYENGKAFKVDIFADYEKVMTASAGG